MASFSRAMLVAAGLASLASTPAIAAAQDPAGPTSRAVKPADFVGLAYVFRADLEHGRRAGWAPAAATDDALLASIETTMLRRVRSVGMFAEARIGREPGARFAVVFVGHMSPGFDRLLTTGLGDAARLEIRPLATDADLESAGSDLRAERARLDAWRSRHSGVPLTWFNSVRREAGGPHAALRWVTETTAAGSEQAVAVLRASVWALRRADVEGTPRPGRRDGRLVLNLTLDDDATARFRRWRAHHAGRILATIHNDRIVSRWENNLVPATPSEESRVVIGVDSVDAMRGLLLAFAGEPLPAPLVFVGKEQRRLREVEAPARAPAARTGKK